MKAGQLRGEDGLSPRVRGKRHRRGCRPPRRRSIPACAGETPTRGQPEVVSGVYPRVCGGNGGGNSRGHRRGGLSPRVRGKRKDPATATASRGSIPACAGETCIICWVDRRSEVYPRVCGGNGTYRSLLPGGGGLSPRVRGKHLWFALPEKYRGSIPACAGETYAQPGPAGPAQVYPRVCGGNALGLGRRWRWRGLSPRVRGKHPPGVAGTVGRRSIPACAGETTSYLMPGSPAMVYPRVCGGNWETLTLTGPRRGLSPRVRGKHRHKCGAACNLRSIPACAGETHVA